MCGRFLNELPVAEIARIFGTRNPLPNYPARFDIAPTDPVLTVRFNPETKVRSLDALRWGLVPHWAKDLKVGTGMISAHAETVATLPAFRDAFKARRCILPASGFVEWKKTLADMGLKGSVRLRPRCVDGVTMEYFGRPLKFDIARWRMAP